MGYFLVTAVEEKEAVFFVEADSWEEADQIANAVFDEQLRDEEPLSEYVDVDTLVYDDDEIQPGDAIFENGVWRVK